MPAPLAAPPTLDAARARWESHTRAVLSPVWRKALQGGSWSITSKGYPQLCAGSMRLVFMANEYGHPYAAALWLT